MYNVSTEQIIKVKAPKNALIFKIIMIIACILAVTTIPQTHAFGLLLFVVLVVFTVFVFRYYNAEYEYSLVDGEFTVDRIMARTRRKRCGVYDLSKAELVAKTGSQDALRMEHRQLRTHPVRIEIGMGKGRFITTLASLISSFKSFLTSG